MRLKILPPTLRINNRYLTLDIKSEVKLNKDELISAIWNSCLRLYGEIETSSYNLWLIRFFDITNNNNKNTQVNNNLFYYHHKAILRCQRGYENKVRGSLALLSKYNHKKITISTVDISGTILSSMESFIN
jgi:ribonuclease P/MRP protein subunit POP5